MLVHSWGGRGSQMGRMTAALTAAGYRAVSFDLPAHGEAGFGETDMVECAAAVAAVAATSVWKDFHAISGTRRLFLASLAAGTVLVVLGV